METILLIDDDMELCTILQGYLARYGFEVITENSGDGGLRRALGGGFAMVLLDVMLPGLDGFEVLRRLRATSQVSVLLLTARGEDIDRIVGLEIGADDYVVKPFGIQELLARVRALLRRAAEGQDAATLVSKELNFDFEKRDIVVRGVQIHLTPKEFAVLKELVDADGRPISHRRLLQSVWGPEYGEETESLRVVINQLRKKIELNPAKPKYIHTEPWVGYRFNRPADARRPGLKEDS